MSTIVEDRLESGLKPQLGPTTYNTSYIQKLYLYMTLLSNQKGEEEAVAQVDAMVPPPMCLGHGNIKKNLLHHFACKKPLTAQRGRPSPNGPPPKYASAWMLLYVHTVYTYICV